MVWIFASVVLVLLVLVAGFRRAIGKTLLVLAIVGVVWSIGYGIYYGYTVYEEKARKDDVSWLEQHPPVVESSKRPWEKDPIICPAPLITNEADTADKRFQDSVATIYRLYPFLDSSSAQANSVAIQAVMDRAGILMSLGIDRERAVLMASGELAQQYGRTTK